MSCTTCLNDLAYNTLIIAAFDNFIYNLGVVRTSDW